MESIAPFIVGLLTGAFAKSIYNDYNKKSRFYNEHRYKGTILEDDQLKYQTALGKVKIDFEEAGDKNVKG